MKGMKLEVIKDLMEELINEMEYGKEDFDKRLGKLPMKGEVEIIKMEGKPEEMEDEEMGMMGEDEEMEDEDETDARIRRMMSSKGF